jgi:hypothetical protein
MSHELRTIAKTDAFHSIAYCSHDALHLNWGNLSVHIPRTQFIEFALMLKDVRLGHLQALSSSFSQLSSDDKGNFKLRFRDLAIFLSVTDLLQLISLLEEALIVIGERHSVPELDLPTRPVSVEGWTSGRYRPP